MGKVIPFDRGAREGQIIRLVPKCAKSGSLVKRIGAKGVQALRWFVRLKSD